MAKTEREITAAIMLQNDLGNTRLKYLAEKKIDRKIMYGLQYYDSVHGLLNLEDEWQDERMEIEELFGSIKPNSKQKDRFEREVFARLSRLTSRLDRRPEVQELVEIDTYFRTLPDEDGLGFRMPPPEKKGDDDEDSK